MKIYKYPIGQPDGYFGIEMPKGAKLLSVQGQYATVCIWALVDPDAEKVARCFRMYGTGHPMSHPELPYVGTFQVHGGQLVFHLFDAGEEPLPVDDDEEG